MEEIDGIVKELKCKGLECPTVVLVEYKVNDITYEIEESIKYKVKTIKLGFIPIGQKIFQR